MDNNTTKSDPESALQAVREVLPGAGEAMNAAREVLDRLDKHEEILTALVAQAEALTMTVANHEKILERITGFRRPAPPTEN